MFIETFEAILTVFFVGVAVGVFFWLRHDVKKHEKEVQKLQHLKRVLFKLWDQTI